MSETLEMLDSLGKQGVILWGEGSMLRFRASKGALTGTLRSQLTSQKETLLAGWREQAAQSVVSHPAAHGQKALWFLHQSHPESASYNVIFTTRIRSTIDLPALRRSFQALVDRHPSLRTTFREESDRLLQQVHGYMPVCFNVHHRPGIDLPTLQKEVHDASHRAFDLQNGPLVRVDLFARAPNDQILLFAVHHIAADGWSLFLLLDDLRRIYPAERNSSAPPPARPVRDILDHSRWQEAMLAGPEGDEHEAYWLSKLAGILTPLSIPTDRPRPLSLSDRGASIPIDLGEKLSNEVRVLAAKEGTTPFVVLLSAYQVLLHRYTGQHEVIVGSPTYGRDRANFADVVGDFINTIPLKAEFHDDPPFRALLARVRQTVVEGIQHQDYPFPLLVEKLQPDRDFSRTPVFQTVFILQKFKPVAGLENVFTNTETDVRAEFAGLMLEQFPVPQQEGQFELSLELAEKDGVLQGFVKYNPDLFDLTTMRRLASHYVRLMESIIAAPATNVSRLSILGASECEELIAGLNPTDGAYAKEKTVVDLIGEQTVTRPDAIAVSFEGGVLTYRELDIRSNRLARYIRSLGVKPESLVGVCLERGLEMLITVLAVLKAGGAYVPLDPAFPAERLRYMVEDSGAKVLVTQRKLSEALFSGLDPVRVYLDEDKDRIEQHGGEQLSPLAGPLNRAYVLYTSGSTGRPKGVEIEHRALTNFLCSMAREPGLRQTDVLLAVTTLAFDISGLELFLPLITGARIELASRETTLDGVALARTLSASGATVMQATPATWRMLFESGWRGDRRLKVLCGGEAMDRDLAARLTSTCGSVWNMYGPTETTIWSSVARIESEEVTIGRPIANTRMYVLDGHQEPVPRGVVGELWIGGEGVARGYLNRAELTGERFVRDPYHEGARMYRTGDLARHLPDGRLECLGRIDNQVKIRGYRIELEEIEAALSAHSGVYDCVVTARKEHAGDLRLLAYVVPNGTHRPAIEDLRTHLKTILPDYMVPSGFAFLDAMPMTPNGKVNRNALPTLEEDLSDPTVDYVAPRNHVERVMAEMWAEVLGVKSVGVFDHFFELGGHSLSAARLASRIRAAFSIELSIRMVFDSPRLAQLARFVEEAQQTAQFLRSIERVRPTPTRIPLSYAQQRLWFLFRLEGPSATYNMPVALRLEGELDEGALEAALNDVIGRHESLRTIFSEEDGIPYQQILLPQELGSVLTVEEIGQGDLAERLAQGAATALDLSCEIPLRAWLYRLGPKEHVLLLVLHHIAGDGWSRGPLSRDFALAYAARCRGAAPDFKELRVQYTDYTLWQRKYLGEENDPDSVLGRQLRYWRAALAGAPEELNLPTDHKRPTEASYRGGSVEMRLDADLHRKLSELGKAHGASLFMVLQAGLAALLSRLGAGEDIPIGSPIAGRVEPMLEELIGVFVNTLVMRTDVSGDPSFVELLGRVRSFNLEAYGHEDLPFERLVEALRPERSAARHPLFQVMLALQNVPEGELKMPGLTVNVEALSYTVSRIDLTLSLSERVSAKGEWLGIEGSLEYSLDLYERDSVENLVARLVRLLKSAVATPDERLHRLDILASEERQQLLESFNATEHEVSGMTVMELIEAQAARTPQAVAVIFGEESLSYSELNVRANRLARYIRSLGVKPESLVGVCLERGLEMLITVLAVLKAGGAYVPLDPAFPAERLRYMVEDSGAKVLVTQRKLSEALFSGLDPVRVYLDEDKDRIEQHGGEQLSPLAGPLNRAYVLYTSGSTGRPKGVEIEHRALTNFLCSMAREPGLRQTDVLLAVTTLAFDISGLELFLPLITGARIELASRETTLDGVALARTLSASGATVMQATPATWRMLFESGWRGDRRLKVLCGGEAMDRDLAARLTSTCGSVWNMYGPTETTIWSSVARIESEEVTIGRPIANTRMYVLDGHQEPVPRGVVGELWIGGEGVARGYLNRAELTGERFVRDPYHEGARMYRTGDLARHLPDGRLECLGRIDNQVKIRGYRIELEEIEAALSAHSGVYDCVVTARKEHAGDLRLLAYVVPNGTHRPAIEDLRTHLKTILPDYMVPSGFAFLDAMPMTPNGKVNRNALPTLEEDLSDPTVDYVAPRNHVERVMAEMWAEVLGVKSVGVFDHFFELGGHSLSAARLASRIRAAFSIELSIRMVFDSPRLAQLARFVEEAQQTAQFLRSIERVRPTPTRIPLSYAQQRLWFLFRLEGPSATYNMPVALRLEGELDEGALEAALNDVIGRHESLRTIFSEEDGIPYQQILLPQELGSVLTVEEIGQGDLAERLAQGAATALDLSCEIPLRAWLYRLGPKEHVLLLVLHHIAGDGWSRGPLSRDFALAYAARCRGAAPDFKELRVQYTDYTLWQRKYLGEENDPDSVLGRQLRYWRAALAGAPEELNLPTDHKRPTEASYRGGSVEMRLDADLHRKLSELGKAHGASLFMVLQAGLAALLSRLGAGEDIPIGSPIAGRVEPMLEELIGVFVNTLVMRTDVSGDPSFVELLGRVRSFNLEAYGHEDLPFERLVEALRPERSAARHPLFQVMLALQNVPEGELKMPGLTVNVEALSYTVSRIDLTLSLSERVSAKGEWLGIEGSLEYSLDLYERDSVENLVARLVRLLKSAVATPDERLHRLDILASEERQQLLESFNATEHEVSGMTVMELIEAQAARTPQAVAVIFGEESLSYSELNVRANRLARYIRSLGVKPESLVGVCLERGLEMLITVLAVLKAGGAYVPLDPAFPAERLRYMVEDSGAKVLVTQRKLSEALFSGLDPVRVYLDEDKDRIEQHGGEQLSPLAGPLNRAYVLYTSGSTGRPKGVEIEHRALTNFLCSMAREPGLRQTDVLLAVTTLAFDISGLELFLPLITGARIELASRETTLDGVALARTLSASGATVMQATPATWRMLFESGWRGDRRLKVLCGGEAMDRDLAARLTSTCGSVWNMYGPTETTIWSSVARIESEEVTIGRPIANTRMYVLDGHQEPVPRGVVGELWIGGEGVARGYLNRAELTGERFVRDPYHEGARMYRTGDLARHLPDGRLECLGRIDNQVKIRGYRIELEEIEAALSAHSGVYDCVVTARKEHAGDLRLLAYVVPNGTHRPAIEDLRTHLKTILPDYMVPSGFAFLDAMPMTSNGKVNRSALPIPGATLSDLTVGYVPPRNQVEHVMAGIWADVLEINSVGVFDHFFELGGHSLSATRVIARLKDAFQVDLPLRSIFVEPTIAGMSKHILYDEATQRYYHVGEICRWNRLVPAQPKGSRVPFFMVAGFMDADDTLRVLSRLIPHLGLDQPVYGFQPRWLDGQSERYTGAEEAASEFLADLRTVQPKGPYLLGGDCAGGIVAMVMAQELLRQGEEVRLLVMFDTHRPTELRALGLDLYNGSRRAIHILNVFDQIIRASGRLKLQLIRELFRRKLKTVRVKTRDESAFQRVYRLRMDYMRTMYRHRFNKYPGRITLINNEKQHKYDKNMGWKGVASGGLEVHSTPGDHWTRYLHGEKLAKRLLECLLRAQGPAVEHRSGSNHGTPKNNTDVFIGAATIVSAMISDL